MIGIGEIGYSIGKNMLSNEDRLGSLSATPDLLENKIGVKQVARKDSHEETSDLALSAVQKLFNTTTIRPEEIECLILITQNPDGYGLPHTSAILHHKAGLPPTCAAFDISLGCSGFVYGLSVISAFMEANGMTRGLLVTADPYSKIVDDSDRNTTMLFGDGATATLITDEPIWSIGKMDFGTQGDLQNALEVTPERILFMNGRAVFNFCAQGVPKSIQRTLDKNNLSLDEIDLLALHQGSKFIVDTIGRRLGVAEKTPFLAADYGNTVSSSIPIILADNVPKTAKSVLISGFGVGLSCATTVLQRV
jgi:3-oxoacyl-[acyl-carrier-protein] synthase III